MIYIHFGHSHFIPALFSPIRNRRFAFDYRSVPIEHRKLVEDIQYQPKPEGGLWASRIDDPNGWKAWCRNNHFRIDELDRFFTFSLCQGSRVVTIASQDDLIGLPMQKAWKPKDLTWLNEIKPGEIPTLDQLNELYSKNPCFLDFEKLVSQGIDALEITDWSSVADAFPLWDCNSLLILNSKVIELQEQ